MEDNLSAIYKNRFKDEFLPRKREIWRVLCQKFFQLYINKSSSVLDVACGFGEFINHIEAEQKYAVDLNLESEQYLSSDITFIHASALDIEESFSNKFDVIFTSNFLEHLKRKADLEQLLDSVKVMLKSGGKFIIMGPNLRYLPGQYWDFYDHDLGITDKSLSEVLRMKGFEIETCMAKFLPFTTQGKLPTHPILVKLYLKMPIFWHIFGKQFFIVAKKE